MKKSELTQLTQIIEHLVHKEIRKQLPSIIAETFQNMMGKRVVTEQRHSEPHEVDDRNSPQEDELNLKASLREMFAGTAVMNESAPPSIPRAPKQYAKDPILNKILNETTSDLRMREGMVGMAAMAGGYNSTFQPVTSAPMMSMEDAPDPAFMCNVPPLTMGGHTSPMPLSRPHILSESNIPMSDIPHGVSALDIARQVPLAQPVAHALTKNYSQMMKLIAKKKGEV